MSTITVIYKSYLNNAISTLTNNRGDSIETNNPKEVLDFLCRQYGIGDFNKKLAWDIDSFASAPLQILGKEICKRLIIPPLHEVYFYFDGDKIIFRDISEIPKTEDGKKAPLPENHYHIFYHSGTIFGIEKENVYNYIYHLKQYIPPKLHPENGKEPEYDEIYNLYQEFSKSWYKISNGKPPKKMSSTVSLFTDAFLASLNKNVAKRGIPTIAEIPDTLAIEETEELINWCRETSNRVWIANYAIGNWLDGESHDYDLSSAYGFNLSNQYDFRYAEFKRLEPPVIPSEWDWGVMKGRVKINDDVIYSPIAYKLEDNKIIFPTGEWDTILTLPEALWIRKHGIGSFKLEYGYFWNYRKTAYVKPFEKILNLIFNYREEGGIIDHICKQINSQVWGKLIQRRGLGDGEVGEYENPIFAMQTKVLTRLQVANFIYSNHLEDGHVLSINTDGLRTDKFVNVSREKRFGQWRYQGDGRCIILSPGRTITDEKHPGSLYYSDIVNLIENDPSEASYIYPRRKRTTLGEAVAILNDLSQVGKINDFPIGVNLLDNQYLQCCEFKKEPDCGKDLITGKFFGKPIKIRG